MKRSSNDKVDVLEESAWDEMVGKSNQTEMLKGIMVKIRYVVAPFPWPNDDAYFRNCRQR